MQANEQNAALSGEARARQRQRRFWTAIAVPALATGAILIGVEYALGYKPLSKGSTLSSPLAAMDATFAVIFSVVVSLAILVAAIWYHRVTDEADERAVLWGNSVSIYSLIALAFVADALTAARLIPAMSHSALMLLCLVPGFATYFWVKFR